MTIKLNYKNLFDYLIDAAICKKNELENMTVDVKHSKNWHWVLNLENYKLVVKQQSDYCKYHIGNRISNEWHIYRFLQSCSGLFYASSLTPEIIHFDEMNSILIYKYKTDYTNLESYYEKNTGFPIALAKSIGTALATLHLETMNSQDCYNFFNDGEVYRFGYHSPYIDYILNWIEPENLNKFPGEILKFIALYQRYEKLKDAVTELVIHHPHCCLTHNNLHLNKIMISRQWERLLSKTEYSDERLIKLINWEESSWGDPACDLGTAIAGYLLVWLNSMTVHPAIELEKSLQLATIPLERIYPSIVAMTRAYIRTSPKVLEDRPDFLKRVIQFSGLVLIYKVMEMIDYHKAFNNHGICMLQVAKSLLCQPDQSFNSVFGLTELALIDPALHSIN